MSTSCQCPVKPNQNNNNKKKRKKEWKKLKYSRPFLDLSEMWGHMTNDHYQLQDADGETKKSITHQNKARCMISYRTAQHSAWMKTAKNMDHTTALAQLRGLFFEPAKTLTVSKWKDTSAPNVSGWAGLSLHPSNGRNREEPSWSTQNTLCFLINLIQKKLINHI